jgi:hypothetical protein
MASPPIRIRSQGIFCLSPHFWGGGPLVPSGPIFVPFLSFLNFLSHILRNFFTFKFSQIQNFGGETVIVVMLRHFPQNRVSNMPHDYIPTTPHVFVSATNHR